MLLSFHTKCFVVVLCSILVGFVMSHGKNLRILGGTGVDDGDVYPYVVYVRGKRNYCTGSIIHKYWILTAAHCFPGMASGDSKSINIFAGGTNNAQDTDTTVRVKSERLVIHPNFIVIGHSTLLNDLALVKVRKPFDFSGCCIRYVRLAEGGFPDVRRLPCTTLGYGVTGDVDSSNTRLYELEVTATTSPRCISAITRRTLKTSNHLKGTADTLLCVEASEGGICSGDSGGPLVCEGILAGVVSFTDEKEIARTYRQDDSDCPSKDSIAIYTYTGSYVAWMREHIPDLPETAGINRTTSLSRRTGVLLLVAILVGNL